MKKNTKQRENVVILSTDAPEIAKLRRMIEDGPYRTTICSDLAALESELASACMAVVLDVDSVPMDNRTIRQLTLSYPGACFLCVSRDRIHPELKEAICYHLFACLTKPVDPDELQYLLKCIRDQGAETRGPPHEG